MIEDKDRIQELLTHLKLSRNALGVAIGDKNGTRFNYIIKGRNGISENIAKKIVETFPEINYEWLKYGVGDMLLKTTDLKKDKDLNYIRTASGELIDIDVIVDSILLNQEKFENNPRFKRYLKTIKDQGIISYQEKLLMEYKSKK
ncbi:conserved hypothetical protein [Tenacibaculum sp. 190524A02b]|uniref:HTH cro/C1-type domain-containing protein n=1 Tax=Tenacibaculum vairaonense TaxID=3137860 RepID=A0ABM9PR00_9FLAO